MRFRPFVLLIILVAFLLNACSNNINRSFEEVEVTDRNIEYIYFDVVDGLEYNYVKPIVRSSLTSIINIWISEMVNKDVDYGLTSENMSILESLSVNYSEIEGNTVIIDFNSDFLEFDNIGTQVGYFMIGLEKILGQTIEAEYYTISIDGSREVEIVHPDGIGIKDVKINN